MTFDLAINGNSFNLDQEGMSFLIQAEPRVFDSFEKWVSEQSYTVPSWPHDLDPEAGEWPCLLETMHLLVLSEKCGIPALKDCIMDVLRAYAVNNNDADSTVYEGYVYDGCPPSMRAIKYVYHNTLRGSDIRAFLAKWYAYAEDHQDPRWIDKEDTRDFLISCPDFAVDLLVILDKFKKPQTGLLEALRE